MALDLNDPEVKEAVAAAAAALQEGSPDAAELARMKTSIEALEGNNAKLVTEKKAEHDAAKVLREKLDGLGGDEEIAKLIEASKQADKAAALQQLVDGNFEEFTAAITEKAVAALTKQLSDATGQVETANGATAEVTAKFNAKLVDIAVRDAAAKASVHPTAIEDIVARAQQTFSVNAEDAIGVFDENGLAKVGADGKASYSPAEWLEEQREAASHWWPASQGGGAGGSQGGGQGAGGGNPWAAGSWNMTEQGRVVREQGLEKAESLAKAAGSQVGAAKPTRAA